jgi:methyl-accepting chemotaxis protein
MHGTTLDENTAAPPALGSGPGTRGRLRVACSSVRVRLLAAFSLVAATTVLAAGNGVVSQRNLGATIRAFGEQTIPALMASQQMLELSSDLVVAARGLARAGDEQGREALRHQAEGDLDGLHKLLAAVGTEGAAQAAAGQIGQVLDAFAANLKELDRGAASLLAATTLRSGLVDKANAARDAAVAAANPMVITFKTRLSVKMSSMASAADMTEVQQAVDDMDEQEVNWLVTAQNLQTGISNLHALLITSAAAPNVAALAALAQPIEVALLLPARLKLLPAGDLVNKFAAAQGGLTTLFAGADGIVPARTRELEAAAAVEQAIERNTAIAQRLSTAVRSLADGQKEAVTRAIAATGHGISRDLWTFAGLGAVSVLAALLLGWFYVSNDLVRRIVGLRDAMLGIAAGRLDTPFTARGSDEIAAMASALTVFRDNAFAVERLRQEQERERAAGEQRRRAALIDMAARLEANAGPLLAEVMTAAERLHGTAGALSAAADGANARTEAVSAASVQTTGNVRSVAAATEQLSLSIKDIARQVAASAALSQEAEAEAAGTGTLVASLRDASGRIGTVFNLIGGIASKTNLLALNATIEASRAGEAGRGFAVVASEVKALATQTANATKEIAAHVASMQQVSENSGAAIGRIAGIIGKLHAISTAIAASVEEQSAATEEIVRNVDGAAEKIANVEDGIAGVRGAAGDTRAASSDVLASAGELSTDARRLRTEVHDFLASVRAA